MMRKTQVKRRMTAVQYCQLGYLSLGGINTTRLLPSYATPCHSHTPEEKMALPRGDRIRCKLAE
jgi:hypothetical protein